MLVLFVSCVSLIRVFLFEPCLVVFVFVLSCGFCVVVRGVVFFCVFPRFC